MRKSKFIFLILCVTYVLVGIGSMFNLLDIGNNVLLGLSVAALLISVGDVFDKIAIYRIVSNFYYMSLNLTINFLNSKIQTRLTSHPIINIRNVTEGLVQMQKKNYTPCHPADYKENKLNNALKIVSFFFFVFGIASFIILPFINVDLLNTNVTTPITIFAFSAMSLSLFLDELIQNMQDSQNDLVNDKHLIIQSVYSDFQQYYSMQMYYRNDLIATKDDTGWRYEPPEEDDEEIIDDIDANL